MQLIINNWLGGIAPSDRLGKESSYYGEKAVDPIRKLGYLSPGFRGIKIAQSDDTPAVLTKGIHSYTFDPKNIKMYLIENSPEIHQINAVTMAALVDDDPTTYPHTIGDNLTGHGGHTTFTGEDVIIYPIGATHYLFYSWNDNTDGDVGRAALTGAPGFEDDNLSNTVATGAVLTLGVPHRMMEWQENGYLYITNGRYLAELDGQTGANGTADMTAFTLPVGWTAVDIFPAGDLIGICAEYIPGAWTSALTKRKRTAVFFWDGSSTKWTRKALLDDPQIVAGRNLEGEYYLFCNDVRAHGVIRKWNGLSFVKEQELRHNISGISTKAPLTYSGVCEWRNGFLINDHAGRVYYYGSIEPGLTKALYHIFESNDVALNAGYAIAALDFAAGSIVASSYDGTNYHLRRFWEPGDGTYNNTNFLYKSLYYEFPHKIRINYVRLYFNTLLSGADDDVKIEQDYGNKTTTLGSISYALDGALEYKRFNKLIKCHNFRVIIDTDGANSSKGIEYAKIVIDYDFVGDDD